MRTSGFRKVALILALATLVFGPWAALTASAFGRAPAFAWAEPTTSIEALGQVRGPDGRPIPPARRAFTGGGCTCRDIEINADNVVRDAEVETGDAKVVNRSITYVAPSYEDTEVEVDQEAEARSGDAIAGQVIGVNAGDGCARVHVNARNIVEDAEVRSGDAEARNESIVLLDPRVARRGDVEVDVDQDAVAESGDAIAGQIIGVTGGGGPCGGVTVDAFNRVKDTEVESGEATFKNVSDIQTCRDEGCLNEIRLMLMAVEVVEVCHDDECEELTVDQFIRYLKRQANGDTTAEPTEEDDAEPDKHDDDGRDKRDGDDDDEEDEEDDDDDEDEDKHDDSRATDTMIQASGK